MCFVRHLGEILCHNGEFELKEYRPVKNLTFEKYDSNVEECYVEGGEAIKKLVPSTLEGCVVRICDMIAYIGKDGQDAITAKILPDDLIFSSEFIGSKNAEMINNLTVDIVNNSFGKNCIILSEQAFNDLKTAKKENYEYIYKNEKIVGQYNEIIKPMFNELYYKTA